MNKSVCLYPSNLLDALIETTTLSVMPKHANPPDFNWWGSYGRHAAPFLAVAAVASLALYALVRAIGWVIGGFAAS
jgi:hypothetical protein